MRDQGRLVEWFDEQGYGFIQPQDLSKDRVFLHIQDFSRPGPRPIIGCALQYTVTIDHRSRYRALDVVYLKASQVQHISPEQHRQQPAVLSWQPLAVLSISYILIMTILTLCGLLNHILLWFLLLMNVVTYWCYAQDKAAARLGGKRMPERSLHLLALLGGWPAAWLAQQKLRHKTQKHTFKKVYLYTIAFNILLIICLASPLNPLIF